MLNNIYGNMVAEYRENVQKYKNEGIKEEKPKAKAQLDMADDYEPDSKTNLKVHLHIPI